MSVDKLL